MDNLILKIIFENEEVRYYDVKNLICEHKEFEILKDINLFTLVKVDTGGYGISWNDELDISCNTLYYGYDLWQYSPISLLCCGYTSYGFLARNDLFHQTPSVLD